MEPEILLHKYQSNRKTIGSLIHFFFDCKTTAHKFNTTSSISDFLQKTTFGIGLKALYFPEKQARQHWGISQKTVL
jgi:hypothetical protein